MYYIKKLKTDKRITGLLPAIVSLILFGFTSLLFGPNIGLNVLGLVILVYSVFQFIAAYRTRSIGYTISAIYLVFLGLYINSLYFNPYSHEKFILNQDAKLLFIIVICFLLVLVYMLFTKRVKWRGREIMELAAQEIDPGEDTYTDRPRPVDKMEYTKDQLFNFAEFLKRNLVAMPYFESERIIFIPIKMGYEFPFVYGGNINHWEKTWVAFDFAGNVSAHISKIDYLDYMENLTFDPLCAALGEQFIEFFEFFKKGEQVRIIDKLNQIKVGFFS